MTAEWTLTFDAHHPPTLAAFWSAALGYVPSPPPKGFASWEVWFERFGVSDDEHDDLAAIVDPDGVRPRISFLRVPEPKTAKNRIHLDVQVGGGRAVDPQVRWARVQEVAGRLLAAGATTHAVVEGPDGPDGPPDHLVLLDPEGNEFCVV